MSTMTFNLDDFNELVGKKFTIDELSEKMPMLGTSWEGIKENEIEIEVFPNRPDMLSVEGLARAFAGFAKLQTGLKKYDIEKNTDYEVIIDPTVERIRPHIACAIVKNVKFTDESIKSIMQIQEKLHTTFCRRRAKASIGIYDLDSIQFPVTYTVKPTNFKFTPLEFHAPMTLKEILEKHPKGIDYAWILKDFDKYPILIDSKDMVLSMAPIINSEDSKVKEGTTNLFIDVTGTDQKTINEVLNIIVCALADRGGKLYSVKMKGITEMLTPTLKARSMQLKLDYVNKLLGIKLNVEKAIEYLQMMRFDAIEMEDSNEIEVIIPPYRTDIMHPMDLVEDIAIAYGYENFKPELPNISTIGEENPDEIKLRRIRELMIGFGFQEALNYMLTNRNNNFTKMKVDAEPVAEIMNSTSSEYDICRNWILPSLMKNLETNKHNLFPQRIFEIGRCVKLDEHSENGVKIENRLAFVCSQDGANLTNAKSIIESFLKNLGLKAEIRSFEHNSFIPGRCGGIYTNDSFVGFFGEIHPEVLDNWNLEMPVIAGEIYLDHLKI